MTRTSFMIGRIGASFGRLSYASSLTRPRHRSDELRRHASVLLEIVDEGMEQEVVRPFVDEDIQLGAHVPGRTEHAHGSTPVGLSAEQLEPLANRSLGAS